MYHKEMLVYAFLGKLVSLSVAYIDTGFFLLVGCFEVFKGYLELFQGKRNRLIL